MPKREANSTCDISSPNRIDLSRLPKESFSPANDSNFLMVDLLIFFLVLMFGNLHNFYKHMFARLLDLIYRPIMFAKPNRALPLAFPFQRLIMISRNFSDFSQS